ncbi:interferon-induced protein 44-like [Toxotes jaculatrix]|uniref:interferon-induced protein 44-like n=1 Tax=Toxotes jaculatrix TaxID=941984 RepID=UPI001B3B14BF|nr:interferon-induced protein 44-like [Toxotes jaculatrix]
MGALKSRPVKADSPTFSQEWRKIPWGDKEKYLKTVKEYYPQKDELKALRILLHGPAGSGKSSFINSVDSVLKGRMAGRALADAISQDSFTIKYGTYKISKGGPGTFYPFVFTDIMGLEKGSSRGVGVDDIKLAMEGHVKEGYKFSPGAPLSEKEEGYNKDPRVNDRVHVLVCVISATTLNILPVETARKMRDVRIAASNMGIPQLALLTKIDEACTEVNSNLKNVYKSKYVKQLMERLNVLLGIPMNCIFPVKNYHEEIDTDDDIDTLILCALTHMIHYGEDFLNNQ